MDSMSCGRVGMDHQNGYLGFGTWSSSGIQVYRETKDLKHQSWLWNFSVLHNISFAFRALTCNEFRPGI